MIAGVVQERVSLQSSDAPFGVVVIISDNSSAFAIYPEKREKQKVMMRVLFVWFMCFSIFGHGSVFLNLRILGSDRLFAYALKLTRCIDLRFIGFGSVIPNNA